MIEEKAPLIEESDLIDEPQLKSIPKLNITVKLVFYENMVGFLIGSGGIHTKTLLDKYDV